MGTNFTPDYRDIDFQTMVTRLRTILSNVDDFKDYNFEGANITILMELVSYVGDLNTYFTNKLAQNIHTETANVYEVVHSLVRQQGHEPAGYVGAELVLDLRVYRTDGVGTEYYKEFDQLYIPQWFRIDTGLTTESGEPIYYIITEPVYKTVVPFGTTGVADDEVAIKGTINEYVDIQITVRQGELYSDDPVEYTGNDMVSNQIVLPFANFDMSTYPYNESPQSIVVTVGEDETAWVRINDFFDDISGLVEENNAYMLTYDKYGRYVLSFSNTRNIPSTSDPIKVYLVETLGLDGQVSSGVWSWDSTTDPDRFTQLNGTVPNTSTIFGSSVDFISNITGASSGKIPVAQCVMRNVSGSGGGSNPQTLDELKDAGKAAAQSQQRNVTRKDYIGNLERRGDITKANAWGEQEENPTTLILENYNKAYISIIPSEWDSGNDDNVVLTPVNVTGTFTRGVTKSLDYPLNYNSAWTSALLEYLEPRKMLGIYEVLELTELVYFRLDFGLKVKRSYNWIQVQQAVKNKLGYYFQNNNRRFGELIDFRDITAYILNTSDVSPTDDFALVRGIQHLVVRDIMIYRDPSRLESGIASQEECEYMGGTWTTSCSLDTDIDEMYIYPENIYNYFPHYVELGYVQNNDDTTYNDLQSIQLGFKQFPQIAIDLCVFTNEG